MSDKAQANPTGEIELLEAQLEEARGRVESIKASVARAAAEGQDNLQALKAEHVAALEQLEAAYKAKVKAVDANRDGLWKEVKWRRKAMGDVGEFRVPMLEPSVKPADSGGSVGKSERGVLEADPTIKIPASLQASVDGVLAWGASIRAKDAEALFAPDALERHQGRLFQHYIHHLLYDVHWLGRWQSVLDLADVWVRLIAKFPRLWLTYNQLEQSLVHDCIVGSLYALEVHADMDARVKAAEKVLLDYFKLFEEDRLADAAKVRHLKPGPGVFGKPLFHSTKADYNAFEFRHLLWGKPEDRAAADYLAGVLYDSLDFVIARDGKKIAVPSHGVERRYLDQVGKFEHDIAHWSVYLTESMSDLEMGALMGFKFMTPKVVDALGRMLFWTLPTQGRMGADQFAKDSGGGGLWKGAKSQRVVQFRDGTTTAGRWKIMSFGESQGVHSFQRGHVFIGAYRQKDLLPVWKPELEALDKRALLGRHATRQALLNIEMKGERL